MKTAKQPATKPASHRELPILFSGPMVQAILAGRKTQTRRVIKPVRGYEHNSICRPDMAADPWAVWWHSPETDRVGCLQTAPHGKPSDRLWVRESFCIGWPTGEPHHWSAIRPTDCDKYECRAFYRADGEDPPDEPQRHWTSGRFMPKRFTRIWLEITAVKVERLQDISDDDAKAEGAPLVDEVTGRVSLDDKRGSYLLGFQSVWQKINGKTHPWGSNPWVWAYTFQRAFPDDLNGGREWKR